MRHKIINEAPEKTFALVFDPGDEIISSLQNFCDTHSLTAARFTAIGAFSSAQLGYFDWGKKDYEQIPVNEQVEVLSLIGDVALYEGKSKIHAHVVLGKRDGSAHGGHLLHAFVRPTVEVVMVESPGYLKRTIDPESGLPLIDVGA